VRLAQTLEILGSGVADVDHAAVGADGVNPARLSMSGRHRSSVAIR
jgi:hypothetical protein